MLPLSLPPVSASSSAVSSYLPGISPYWSHSSVHPGLFREMLTSCFLQANLPCLSKPIREWQPPTALFHVQVQFPGFLVVHLQGKCFQAVLAHNTSKFMFTVFLILGPHLLLEKYQSLVRSSHLQTSVVSISPSYCVPLMSIT